MYHDFSRNNCSTSNLPQCVLDGSWDGRSTLKVTRRCKFIPDNLFKKGFDIEADWTLGTNFKGVHRVHKSGGMNRLDFMRFYRHGVLLTHSDRDECIRLVKARIKRNLGINFTHGYLFFSRFNYICTYPYKTLVGLDVHHIVADNKYAKSQAKKHGVILDNDWLRGTDDRIENMSALTPEQHCKIHELQGDLWFQCRFRDYAPNVQVEIDNIQYPLQTVGFSHLTVTLYIDFQYHKGALTGHLQPRVLNVTNGFLNWLSS